MSYCELSTTSILELSIKLDYPYGVMEINNYRCTWCMGSCIELQKWAPACKHADFHSICRPGVLSVESQRAWRRYIYNVIITLPETVSNIVVFFFLLQSSSRDSDPISILAMGRRKSSASGQWLAGVAWCMFFMILIATSTIIIIIMPKCPHVQEGAVVLSFYQQVKGWPTILDICSTCRCIQIILSIIIMPDQSAGYGHELEVK